MIRFLASFLVALAMFLSPLAMASGGGMAVAHTTKSQVDEGCARTHHSSSDEQKSDMKTSCAIACAAITGTPSSVHEQIDQPNEQTVIAAAHVLTGIWPEGETPPPRIDPEI